MKKRLRKYALSGSPGTACAGEATLDDFALEQRSSALVRIIEGEEESKPSCDEGYTASQQIAKEAIKLKKLQQKQQGGA